MSDYSLIHPFSPMYYNYRPNTLNATIEMMVSDDYRERFRAEYAQLVYRFLKLDNMIVKYYNNELEFSLSCPINLLLKQLDIMADYLTMLEARAAIEKIDIEDLKPEPIAEKSDEDEND